MIKSITLENWRTHKNSELEFEPGTNVIVGVMGAGKSSLVNALSFALFGTFPSLKNRQVSLEEIIMSKPNKADTANVKVVLEYADKEYSVEREIKVKGTNSAKLFENGKLIAGPKQKEVTENIERILGVNYDLFSRAIYSEQNETDFFLKLSPRDRKQKFDDLLNLERYENARKNCVSLQNQLKRRALDESEFLQKQKEGIKEEDTKSLQNYIDKSKKEIEDFKKEVLVVKKETADLKKNLDLFEEKEKENKIYEDLLIKIESKIESIKEILEKDSKISLDKVQKDLKIKLIEVEKVKKELEKVKTEKESLNAKLSKTNEETKVLDYKKRDLEKELNEINSIGGTCPVCRQNMDEKHKERVSKENGKKIEDIEKTLKTLEKEHNELNEKLSRIKENENKLSTNVDEYNKNIYSLETDEKKAIELKEKKEEMNKLKDEPKKLKEEIKKINFKKEEMDKLKDSYFQKKSSLNTIESKISSKKELVTSHESSLAKIISIQKSIEAIGKRVDTTKKISEDLGVFGSCLVATQTELRENMISTLNEAMSTIWENIYPYKDYVDAKLAISEDGYDLMVRNRNKEWIRVDGILSGGERSAAAICIRIAFALVLTKNLSMLILDEPTHNLDSNAIDKLSEMLREKLPGLVDQIFIITHDKQLESAASANLYLLNRNKDLDEVTRVEIIN